MRILESRLLWIVIVSLAYGFAVFLITDPIGQQERINSIIYDQELGKFRYSVGG